VVRDLREVQALRKRLVASGRMAAVGEISDSLSKEIMEPVMDLRHHLEGLRTHEVSLFESGAGCGERIDSLLEERRELVMECLEGVDRIAKILEEVKGFSRDKGSPRQVADLNQLAEDALRIARAQAHPDTRVEQHLAGSLPVACAPAEIVQVIVNLLVNAMQAVATGGTIRCESRFVETTAQLTVEDDGAGIPSDVLERIFDPFFTTKPVGEGTGLGLAISQHLVRQHGGELQVESEPGTGTRFTLVLPAGSHA